MKRDSVYLAHILEEMAFIEANFSGRSFEKIVQDEVMKRSVLRSLQVLGEASKNLSPETGHPMLWNAHTAAGSLAASIVNCGAGQFAQAISSTLLYLTTCSNMRPASQAATSAA